ncbi:hypothetical protein, partial [Pseudomonas sp. Kh14]|uniref:hypothetical protein n=1 Tax=Pseudomonas sp. Kh14 TaxID=2093745 RepID=UPI0015B48F89
MYDTAAVAPTAEEVLAAITPNNKPGYEFYFAGWDKTFDNVKENLEVNAIINEKLIDLIVTLKIKDEEVYQSVQYGKRMQQYVV